MKKAIDNYFVELKINRSNDEHEKTTIMFENEGFKRQAK